MSAVAPRKTRPSREASRSRHRVGEIQQSAVVGVDERGDRAKRIGERLADQLGPGRGVVVAAGKHHAAIADLQDLCEGGKHAGVAFVKPAEQTRVACHRRQGLAVELEQAIAKHRRATILQHSADQVRLGHGVAEQPAPGRHRQRDRHLLGGAAGGAAK